MTAWKPRKVALLHYSAPPVTGGVESVMLTHARLLIEHGHATTILAGKGEQSAAPSGAELIKIPEMDSQHPHILEISQGLEQGQVPADFDGTVFRLAESLAPILESVDLLIVHNVFTKHFNIPLTAALFRLLDQGTIRRCVAWCHDITWTSSHSRSKVHPGYPWDLLRTYRSDITYVTISQQRQEELAGLFGCPPEQIRIIYNGVDPSELLALSEDGLALIDRLGLWDSDINILMPVRVTQAKNIELALRVVAVLKEKGIQPKLIVTGPPDPHDQKNMEYFHSILSLREQLGIVDQMRFVYESGPAVTKPFLIDTSLVSELFRVSDMLFMPSHREGFGMPILEAALTGMPIFCSDRVPVANEIGGEDVISFSPEAEPDHVAKLILDWTGSRPAFRLRRRVRQSLTWQSIFQHDILPLLEQGES